MYTADYSEIRHQQKADVALAEARHLFDVEFYDGAVSRATSSSLQTVRAVIAMIGQPTDPKEMPTCVRTMVKDQRLPEGMDKVFAAIMKVRSEVDEGSNPMTKERAEQAMAAAARFSTVIKSAAAVNRSKNSPEVLAAVASRRQGSR